MLVDIAFSPGKKLEKKSRIWRKKGACGECEGIQVSMTHRY